MMERGGAHTAVASTSASDEGPRFGDSGGVKRGVSFFPAAEAGGVEEAKDRGPEPAAEEAAVREGPKRSSVSFMAPSVGTAQKLGGRDSVDWAPGAYRY